MSTTAVVVAALIGAGGAVVGGIVGGWFALRAGHRQWRRDRVAALTDRSREAAMSIADAVGVMHVALVTWKANQAHVEQLTAEFNTFSRTVAVQSLALTDDMLRSRVRIHQTLVGYTCAFAERDGAATLVLADKSLVNGDILLDALSAHVHGNALPTYNPPPVEDVAALAEWSPRSPADAPALAAAPGTGQAHRWYRIRRP